jgi:hypothetical protein
MGMTMVQADDYLMSPLGARKLVRHPIAPRLPTLAGKTIGLLDNTKKNADILLKATGEILMRDHAVQSVIYRRKISSSPAAPETMIDEFVQSCDAVINAYGDCGSCTSWCIHDGVTLEKRGTPTATVNSDAFVVLGQQEAIALGLPGLPIVMVAHPMGDIPAQLVRERAEAMVAQVIEVLTGDSAALESRYTDLYLRESDKFIRSGLACEI